MKLSSRALPLALSLLLGSPAILPADVLVWSGGDGDWQAGLATNWDAAATWLDGDSAIFGGIPGLVTLTGPVVAAEITVDADGYIFSSGDADNDLQFDSWRMTGGATAVTLDGSLRATATAENAIGDPVLFQLRSDAELRAAATGSTSRDVSLSFDYGSGVIGGTFSLDGHDTTIGALDSLSEGAGLIRNAGVDASRLTVDFDDTEATFSGVIEDGLGPLSLTKSGTGTLTLSGANTYSGGTTLNDGMLVIANASALGSGDLTIEGGAISIGGPDDIQLANNIVLNGDLTIAYPTSAGGYLDLDGTITLHGDRTIFNDDDIYFNGAIVDGPTPSSLTLRGQGAYGLTGTNTFSGGLTVHSNLFVGNDQALGTGTVTFETAGPDDSGGTLTGITDELTLANNMVLNTVIAVQTHGVVTLNGQISGQGGLLTLGDGTTRLNGDNSYEFGTYIGQGNLIAGHDHALGTGPVYVYLGNLHVPEGVKIANEVKIGDGVYTRDLQGSLAHAIDSTSDLGEIDTHASLLAGELSAGATLTSSFCTCAGAVNEEVRGSDIYHFDGTGTDSFVLQLAIAGLPDQAILGWLNPDGEWVNAVLGNTGNNATGEMLGFEGSYDDFKALYGTDLASYLGAYGRDAAAGGVWAVLNHNSEYAVLLVPEPGSAVLLAVCGALACFVRRRR